MTPDSIYDIYYSVFSNSFLSNLFYNSPFLYVGIFILLNFIFGGLIGCASLAFSKFVKNRILTVLFPFIMLFCVQCLSHYVQNYSSILIGEFSPITFLHPVKSSNASWGLIIIEIIVIFAITFIVFFKKKGRFK